MITLARDSGDDRPVGERSRMRRIVPGFERIRRSIPARRTGGRSSRIASLGWTTGNRAAQAHVQRQTDETHGGEGELDVDVPGETTIEAVAGALRDRGLEVPVGSELSLADYLWTDATRGSREAAVTGTRAVYVRLGPAGTPISLHELIQRVHEEGTVGAGSVRRPTRLLSVGVFRYPSGVHDVQMQVDEIETGRITHAAYVEGGQDTVGIATAADDAVGQSEAEAFDRGDTSPLPRTDSAGGASSEGRA